MRDGVYDLQTKTAWPHAAAMPFSVIFRKGAENEKRIEGIMMNISDYISIAAIILAPIVAVFIGQKLQDRARKRQDKMEIFILK